VDRATTLTLSPISFLAYGWDKRRARRERSRLSERSLHMLDVLGGWPGGWLGRRYFRHKTQKRSFRIVFGLTVGIHVACVVGLGIWWSGR